MPLAALTLAQCAYISDEPLIPSSTANSCGPLTGRWSVVQDKNGFPVNSALWELSETRRGCHFRSTPLEKVSNGMPEKIDRVGAISTFELEPGIIALQFERSDLDISVKRGRYVYAYALPQKIEGTIGYFIIAPRCDDVDGCQLDSLKDLSLAIRTEKSNPKPNIIAILETA